MGKYTKDVKEAFFKLFWSYLGLIAVLWVLANLHILIPPLRDNKIIAFIPEITSVSQLAFSLPAVAMYILILITAIAGYAMGKQVLDQFSELFKQKLEAAKFKEGSISKRIKGKAQVKLDDSYYDALVKLTASRLDILAVLDNEERVTGVLTSHDVLTYLEQQVKSKTRSDEPVAEDDILKATPVSTRYSTNPVTVNENEDLKKAFHLMINRGFNKLVVVDNDNKFKGTIDIMDIVSEIYDHNE